MKNYENTRIQIHAELHQILKYIFQCFI